MAREGSASREISPAKGGRSCFRASRYRPVAARTTSPATWAGKAPERESARPIPVAPCTMPPSMSWREKSWMAKAPFKITPAAPSPFRSRTELVTSLTPPCKETAPLAVSSSAPTTSPSTSSPRILIPAKSPPIAETAVWKAMGNGFLPKPDFSIALSSRLTEERQDRG